MTQKKPSAATQAYDALVDEIIQMLEDGVPPWQSQVIGVSGGLPVNADNEHYNGINIIALWVAQIKHGYSSNRWMTLNQANKLGGRVIKGEKGHKVYWFKSLQFEDEHDANKQVSIPCMKVYTVFNCDQIDGLPEQYQPAPLLDHPPVEPLEQFFANCGADLRDSAGGGCFYRPSTDTIHLPPLGRFESPAAYYATVAHEHIHWTGAKHRLDRLEMKGKFGDPKYAYEELIAELGAAFLMADLGAVPRQTQSHASYCGSWLKALKNDRSMLRKAASQASKAVGWLHDLQPAQAQQAA